jgi:hypothetical protein
VFLFGLPGSAYEKWYIKNSNTLIEKGSGGNEDLVIPEGVRDALSVELGDSFVCEIVKVKR